MSADICVFIVLIIILLYRKIDYFTNINYNKVYSKIDNDLYSVRSDFPDQQQAADILAHLNNMNIEYMRYVRSTRGKASPKLQRLIDELLARYNPQVMYENTPYNNDSPRTTSFTVNKGDSMAICIRSMETGALEDIHTLEFVVLHELAHVITETWGHEIPFWVNFKWVLQNANAAGIHTPIDYRKMPIRYCGMNVNYNPFFDDSIPDIESLEGFIIGETKVTP